MGDIDSALPRHATPRRAWLLLPDAVPRAAAQQATGLAAEGSNEDGLLVSEREGHLTAAGHLPVPAAGTQEAPGWAKRLAANCASPYPLNGCKHFFTYPG